MRARGAAGTVRLADTHYGVLVENAPVPGTGIPAEYRWAVDVDAGTWNSIGLPSEVIAGEVITQDNIDMLILFGLIVGYLLFADIPTMHTLVGGAIVVGLGYWVIGGRPRAAAHAGAETPKAVTTAGCFTSQTMTVAPSRANLSAVARPMPCAAPVMRLIFPWSRFMGRVVR